MQRQGNPPPARGSNPNNPNGFGGKIAFNQISDLPSKYPREELPENLEDNMELGGAYQEFIYKLGDCCGCLKTILQCCCCCVEYPYKQIDQSFVGRHEGRQGYTSGSGGTSRRPSRGCSTSTRSLTASRSST